ncbi:MAG: S8 family serine peptidase [Deltaproteobacteria bacterium]|nr:S8 family serine peptidase [Deltaproteobacteria bacterium]
MELTTGLQRPSSTVFQDRGPADPDGGIRALIALPIRDSAVLDDTIASLYDPASARFRRYLSVDDWVAQHGPTQDDVDVVTAWLNEGGLEVARVSRNRLLLHVTGTVGAFDATFATELHDFTKVEDPDFTTFGAPSPLFAPADIANRLEAVVVADHPADTSPLPGEAGMIESDPPPERPYLSVAKVARAYGLEPLAARGATGRGITIGVVAGAGFKRNDVQSFWQAQGIRRADPVVIPTMEALSTRFTETTIDVEWAGGIAPGAELAVYAGPDAHETSLVYTFNAAIADGRAHVITDSFAHREDATPRAISDQYHASARMAAALGMTVIAAGGDSGQPDVPSSSPLVTSVGGTVLQLDSAGNRTAESAWSRSGSGDSQRFAAPPWQLAHVPSPMRAVSDVAVSAGPYWSYVFGQWKPLWGTSFGAPVVAALIACINSDRREAGEPVIGLFNETVYRDAAVRATFRDVISGETSDHAASVGWDYPTGWGAPDAAALAEVMP